MSSIIMLYSYSKVRYVIVIIFYYYEIYDVMIFIYNRTCYDDVL